MFVDLWVLKPVVIGAAARAGQANAVEAGNAMAGIYGGAQNIARVPYQAILSVTFIIFPLVSQSAFAEDAARTRGYIDRSIRLPLLVVLAMAAAVAARPDALLNVFYPRGEYLPGAPALAVLVFGYVAFSMLSIAGTIINGAGRTEPTVAIGAIALALDAGLCWAGAHVAIATGRDAMLGAALGTTAAMTLGFVASLVYLQRSFGASLRISTVVRGGVAAAAAILVGRLLPLHGKLASLGGCVAAGLVFVAVLFATRELTVRELLELRGRR
jgi:stage V sporulation protein B